MADITKIKVNGTTYNIKDASAVETVTVNNVTLMPVDNDINIGAVVTSESDPTVPSWAKASTKPAYTASEVGAQETLVSGTNIKTINNNSILGSGNLEVGGGGTVVYDGDSTADTPYDNLFMDTVASGVESLIVGGVDFQLLWTNGSPSSSFAGQTVSVGLSDYDHIGIIFRRTTGSTNNYGSPMYILRVGTAWYWDELIGGYMVERGVEVTSTSVIFGDSSRLNTYPNGTRTTDNTRQIPYRIYGVKSATAVSGQAKVKLEWTNPTPTNSFSGDTKISFDTTQYSSIHIFYHQTNGTGVNGYSITIYDRTGANYLVMSYGSKMYKRSARIYDDGILFGDCTYGNTYGATSDTTDNTKMIPYTIFGIR